MKRALRAEWSKTWSDPATVWLLAGLVVVTVAVSAGTTAAARCPAAGCGQDPAKLSLTGVYLGQVVAVVIGVLAIGTEYRTGMIRVTLAAMPRRLVLLAGKILVLAGPLLITSAVTVAVCQLIGRIVLPGHGFTSAHGAEVWSAGDWRASFCTMAYVVLIAVFSLGIATVVRDTAAAAGVVLGALFLLPVLASAVTDPLRRHLEQISPLLAGQDMQATTGLTGLPLAPWPALGVVACWAAGGLLLGGLALRLRDA